MNKIAIAFLVACGSCGGTSSTPMPAATAMADPVPMTEPTPAHAAPADPVGPSEPAQPAAPDPAQILAGLRAAETAAFERAKPVFDKYCAKCHTKDGSKQSKGKLEHFDMTTYPFGGDHAMSVHDEVRDVLGLTGKKPTMPADKKGAVKGDELELVKAWADAFEAAHQGGAHKGHDHHGGGHKH